jgi:hypothetical protein
MPARRPHLERWDQHLGEVPQVLRQRSKDRARGYSVHVDKKSCAFTEASLTRDGDLRLLAR